jgi:hypothetical protein
LDTLIFVRNGVSQLATYGPVLLQEKGMIIYYIVILKSKRLRRMISYAVGQSFFLLMCLCVEFCELHYIENLRVHFPSFIFFVFDN